MCLCQIFLTENYVAWAICDFLAQMKFLVLYSRENFEPEVVSHLDYGKTVSSSLCFHNVLKMIYEISKFNPLRTNVELLVVLS